MLSEFEKWKVLEAQSYLKSVSGAQKRIRSLAETIAEIYLDIANIKAIDYSFDRTDGGATSDALVSLLSDKDERMKECQRQAHELECKVRRALYVFERMEDQTHASILESHYVNGKTWEETAEMTGYSIQSIHKMRETALLGFYEVMIDKDKVHIPNAIN